MQKILLILMVVALSGIASAELDCLDYALESGESVALIGWHPFFYGSIDSEANHYLNYEIIDHQTIIFTDHNSSHSWVVSMRTWDEIRPGVYYDGFGYFKLFIYREPQRYWRKMI